MISAVGSGSLSVGAVADQTSPAINRTLSIDRTPPIGQSPATDQTSPTRTPMSIRAQVIRYRDPAAVMLGLAHLTDHCGLTPRGLLFLALDPRGETYIAMPEDAEEVSSIKVGDKMTLEAPWQGRYFHFDAIHRLPGDTVLWNGDRRLQDTGSASEVACAVAQWLKEFRIKSIFLGCTAHQPGSWWTEDERSISYDLHASGLTSAVMTQSGLLARKISEPHLYHLDYAAVRQGRIRDGWERVHTCSTGNVLMLERRALNYRLVATCESGLVELDISGLPDVVSEVEVVRLATPAAVVGRIDGGGFAITRGRVESWGLAELKPAELIGSANQSLAGLVDLVR